MSVDVIALEGNTLAMSMRSGGLVQLFRLSVKGGKLSDCISLFYALRHFISLERLPSLKTFDLGTAQRSHYRKNEMRHFL